MTGMESLFDVIITACGDADTGEFAHKVRVSA
jgi:hypothetical protein